MEEELERPGGPGMGLPSMDGKRVCPARKTVDGQDFSQMERKEFL